MTEKRETDKSLIDSTILFVCDTNPNLMVLVNHIMAKSRVLYGISYRLLRSTLKDDGYHECFFYTNNPQKASNEIVKDLVVNGLLETIANDPRDQGHGEQYLEMLGTGFLENPLIGFGTETGVTILYPDNLEKIKFPENQVLSYGEDYQKIRLEKKLRFLRAFTWMMTAKITEEKANIILESGSSDEKSMLEELEYVQR